MIPSRPYTDSRLTRRAGWIEHYDFRLRFSERGTVVSLGDGIVWVEGLPSAAIDDLVVFEEGSRALVFHLGQQVIGGILLHQTGQLTAGTGAQLSGLRLSIPVGETLLGRVVDPLGFPLDGLPPAECPTRRPLFAPAPPITARDFVSRPLYTGNKIVDIMIPIGKGQRQLVIGDNGLGKSALAIDAILNQRDKGVRCVYVFIGQKRSDVIQCLQTLRSHDALSYTTLVVAQASALPGLKYLAPFAGCALAEAWMYDGKDTLIIYDDLTMHAQTYRELSLLLRRPPGREAYPGDIFFLHSRLLERSTCLSPSNGGGSMTALPIVETTQGDIAGYIPTNLISITDGQIYLDSRLFAAGTLPAIDVTKSVSRIGGKGQHPHMKRLAGRMKLEYLQFLELEVFTRFGARLEASVEAKIKRGRLLRELLKQDRLAPLSIETQLAWLMAFQKGLFDEVPVQTTGRAIDRLAGRVQEGALTLDSSEDAWVSALRTWFAEIGAHEPATRH